MTTARSHEDLSKELNKMIKERKGDVKKKVGTKKTAEKLKKKKRDVKMRDKM